MKTNQTSITLNDIPESERTPTVRLLLSVIASLENQLSKQSEQLDVFASEHKRLHKLKEKPKLKASKLPKDPDDQPPSSSGTLNQTKKRPGSRKKKKNSNLKVTHEEVVIAKDVPKGAIAKGYKNYFVQDLVIKPVVVKYRLERWQLPNGEYYTAELPVSVKGHHFGATLRAYVLHQHHHQCVTQPLLYEQLKEWGIDISRGQLNRLLIEKKETFHHEKATLLSAGLSLSTYIQVDDTGARHRGVNGYCTHIGNELFAWFESARRKSRINFLQLLQQDVKTYCLTEESFHYMKRYRVAPKYRHTLKAYENQTFDAVSWNEVLSELAIQRKNLKRLITEAALIGSLFANGFSKDMIILSDDAGQFNVFQHALCWIHAERAIKSLIPLSQASADAIEWARGEIWEIYHDLLKYKKNPTDKLCRAIENRFDAFCMTKTECHQVNIVLKKFRINKPELLMVLKHPEIPLHNNLSERDIREYVKRRKISGSTRSDEGRRCRDTFASLKKTAKKLGISFWDYLMDRLGLERNIPQLAQLMEVASNK